MTYRQRVIMAPLEAVIRSGRIGDATVQNVKSIGSAVGQAGETNPDVGGSLLQMQPDGKLTPTPPITKEQTQQFWKATETPVVPLSAGTDPGTLSHGIAQGVESLTTPQNLAIAAATWPVSTTAALATSGWDAVAIRALNAGLGAYFTGQMIYGAGKNIHEAYDAYQRGDLDTVVDKLGSGTVEGLLAGLGAYHFGTNIRDVGRTQVPRPALNPEVVAPEQQPPAAEPAAPTGAPQGKASPARPTAAPGSSPGEPLKPTTPPKPTESETVSAATPNPPTAAVPTAPESDATIALQMEQLGNGQRKIVMIPKGTTPPALGTYPPNTRQTSDPFGNIYIYRNDLETRSAIKRAAKNNTLHELLGSADMGMGAPDKSQLPPDGSAPVVTSHAADGTEVQSTATDEQTLPATIEATQAVTPPGGSVSIQTPEQVVGERQEAQPAPPAPAPAPSQDLAAPQAIEQWPAPQPTPPSQTGLDQAGGEMAAGIAGNMYDTLWGKVQAGDTTESGAPSAILQAAKLVRDRGGLQTPQEFQTFAQEYATIPRDKNFQQAMRDLVGRYIPAPAKESEPAAAPESAAPATPAEAPPQDLAAPQSMEQPTTQVEPESTQVEGQDLAAPGSLEPAGAAGLVEAVYRKLKAGESLGNVTELTKLAEQQFGSSRTSGNWTPKEMFDAMEAGINKYLLEVGGRLMKMDAIEGLKELRELMGRITSQGVRTDEQIKKQQFSTPPTESYLAAKVASLKPTDVVLEPSAGNGGLAAWPKSIGAEVHVNEIAPRRQEMLEAAGFGKPSAHDGEIINALLDRGIQPTVILMNPPFSAGTVKTHQAKNNNLFGFNHVESALQRLAPGGRLVAILGGGQANQPEGGASLYGGQSGKWFSKIAKRYNVRANVRIHGKEYQKYGTNFATRIIVIDKTGPTVPTEKGYPWSSVIAGNVDTLEAAYGLLRPIAESRPAVSARPGSQRGAREGEPGTGLAGGQGNGATSHPVPVQGSGGHAPDGELPSGPAEPDRGPRGGEPDAGDQPAPLREPESEPPANHEAAAAEDPGKRPENDDGERQVQLAGPLVLEQNTSDQIAEEDTGAYVKYHPSLKGPAHPGDIVETKTMSTVPMPALTYQTSLPPRVLEGGLSAVQLEAITIAGQQNDIVLPGGFRASALIGDGTGVGKGRISAGILYDNYLKGRKRLVWVSEKWDLMQDAMRDLTGIGAEEIMRGIKQEGGTFVAHKNPGVVALQKFKAPDHIEHGGVLFSTYSLIRSVDKKGNRRIAQIEQYLRGNDDGDGAYILFDESHNLKNAVVGGGGAKASQIGVAVKELLQRMPKLRTVSLSATAATDVVNLGYLDRLGLWGPGTAFPNGFREFQSQVGSGGLAAMELIARELKAQGKYVSRTLSFKGTSYDETEHKLTADQKALYRTAAKAWAKVVQQAEDTIKTTTNGGSQQKARFMSLFASAQQRFFNILITTLKIPTCIELANKALDDNKSVVITLVNTNEAAQNREKNKFKERDDDDEEEPQDYDFGPKEMLVNLVKENYPVQQWRDDVDDNGKPVKRPVYEINPETGAEIPVNNPQAIAERDALIEEINRDLHLPENPLDILINGLGGPNEVAELTGRKEYYDRATGKFVPRGDPNTARKQVNILEQRAFMSGKKRVAVLSNAAGTGISLHASNTAKNKQRRFHITLQPGWSADKAMQMLGRTHRTDQASAPEYMMLISDLGGEKRFVSTISKRLGSLGALTKGQKNATGGSDLMSKVNFETTQGEQATNSFYNGLLRGESVPGVDLSGHEILSDLRVLKPDPQTGALTVPQEDRTNVTRLLNRLLALDPDVQNPVYDYFYDIFEAAVADAIDRGTLDTGVRELPGDDFNIKDSREIAKDPQTGAKTYYYTVDSRIRNQRVSPEELEKRLDRYKNDVDEAHIRIDDEGKLVLTRNAPPIVHADGRADAASYVAGPGNGKWVKVGNGESSFRQLKKVDDWATEQRDKLANEVKSAERSIQSHTDSIQRYGDSGSWSKREIERQEKKLETLRPQLAEAEKRAADTEAWAKEQWAQQYEAAPTHSTVEHHLIGGAVMKYWNPIKDASFIRNSIFSTTDSKTGQRVVGVQIPANRINPLVDRISGGRSTVTPSQLHDDVLRNGTPYTLERNIRVRQGRIGRTTVIQLIPPNSEVAQRLTQLGAIYERGINPIYYLPNERTATGDSRAMVALTRILQEFPVKTEAPGAQADVAEARRPQAEGAEGRQKNAIRNTLGGADYSPTAPLSHKIAESRADLKEQPGHPPMLFVNRQAFSVLHHAVGEDFGLGVDKPGSGDAVTMNPPAVRKARESLLAWFGDPQHAAAKRQIEHLLSHIDRATADENGRAGTRGLILVNARTDMSSVEVQDLIDEERAHHLTLNINGTFNDLLDHDKLVADRTGRIASIALTGRGYPKRHVAAEIIARLIMPDKSHELGLKSRAQAGELAVLVTRLLKEHNGDAADEIIRAIVRNYPEAKSSLTYQHSGRAGRRSDSIDSTSARREETGPDLAHAQGEDESGPGEPGTAGSVTLGSGLGAIHEPLAALYQKDIVPTAKSISRRLRGALDDLKKVFAPQTRGPLARKGAGLIREMGSELDQRRDRAVAALEGFRQHFYKDTRQEHGVYGLKVYDAIERGQLKGLSIVDRSFAAVARSLFDARKAELQELGLVKTYIDNYLPHEYKNPDEASRWIQNWQQKRPMAGSEAFRKQRTYPTLHEALEDPDFTLEAKFDNPVDFVLSKLGQMDKSILAHMAFEELKEEDLLKYVPAGQKIPAGYVPIDDRIFTVAGPKRGAVKIEPPAPKLEDFDEPEAFEEAQAAWEEKMDTIAEHLQPRDVRVFGRREMGKYYAAEPLARVINNHLSPGISHSELYKAWRAVNNTLNMIDLSVSYYHGLTTTLNSSFSDMALGLKQALHGKPLKGAGTVVRGLAPFASIVHDVFLGTKIQRVWDGKEPNADPLTMAIVDALKQGGGRARQDLHYATSYTSQMLKAFSEKDNPLGSAWGTLWRAPLAGLEQSMKPIMEYMVPRAKLGAFAQLAQLELEKYPDMSVDEAREVFGKIWDSIDDRFGQLSQRNLMMHGTVRDLMNAVVGRPGWNIGTVRALAGGATDAIGNAADLARGRKPEVTDRTLYLLALLFGGAILNGMVNFLLTGTAPKGKDWIMPRDGGATEDGRPSRIVLPTYVAKDLYSYFTRPLATIKGKAAPALTIASDLLTNRNFQNQKILGRGGVGAWNYAKSAVTPYAVQGLERNMERSASPVRTALPFVGIMPAGKRAGLSKAEQIVTDYQDEQRANTRPAPTDHSRARSQVFLAARRGDLNSARQLGQQAVQRGVLTPQDVQHSIQRARQTPLVNDFKTLPLNVALEVYAAATPDERKQIQTIARKKVANARSKPYEWDDESRAMASRFFGIRPPTRSGDFAAPSALQ
jgi:hypothetical protein